MQCVAEMAKKPNHFQQQSTPPFQPVIRKASAGRMRVEANEGRNIMATQRQKTRVSTNNKKPKST
jgi:ribosomal protein L34